MKIIDNIIQLLKTLIVIMVPILASYYIWFDFMVPVSYFQKVTSLIFSVFTWYIFINIMIKTHD